MSTSTLATGSRTTPGGNETPQRPAFVTTHWSVVVSAREEADVGRLASSEQWALEEADEKQRVWTDDYSNVLGAVWRRLRDGEE